MKRKPRRRSEAERFHRARFREEVLGAGYCVEHGSECAGEIQDPHHLVKLAIIRDRLLPRRWLKGDDLYSILFDPRIGVRVCRPFHDELDGHGPRAASHLRAEQIPWQAITFCQDHDLMRELEKAVPGSVEFVDLSAGRVERG